MSRTPHIHPTEHTEPMSEPDSPEGPKTRPRYANRSQSWLKYRKTKPALHRHSSLADLAREHKSLQKHTTNDTRKFYGESEDLLLEGNLELNQDIFVTSPRAHSSEISDYLLHDQEPQSSLPEHSNFIYRTGSQLFSDSFNGLDPNILSYPGSSQLSQSRPISRSASTIHSRAASRAASVTPSREYSVTGSRDVSSGGEEEEDDEAVLFVGRTLRRRPYDVGESYHDDEDQQTSPKAHIGLQKLGLFMMDVLGLDPSVPKTVEKKQTQRERFSGVLDPALVLAFVAAYLI